MSAPDLPGSIVVSIIIPAYGRTALLRKTVEAAIAQDLEPSAYEVIVVDGSPDETNANMVAELAHASRCSLRCFRKRPEGPGPSRNLGAAHSRGRYLAFMDSDCQATPGWLRAGVAAFDEGIGLVQGRTLPDPDAPHNVFNRHLAVERENALYETANIFYRREAFERSGGFLPDMAPTAERPVGGEDVDLAWKVKRAGWKSRFASEALVYHAVTRLAPWRWVVWPHLYICPRIVRDYPEVRAIFFLRYFYDAPQAYLILALAGLGLTFVSVWFWALIVPYFAARTSEPSRTLRGPLRLARTLLYLPRDFASLCILVAGSLRYGALLL